jgi:putative transposase
MSRYRRSLVPGATYFFTLALEHRGSNTLTAHVDLLRHSYRWVIARRPVRTIAISILPDHLHAVWELPPGDDDFATRWRLIKGMFSRGLPSATLNTSQRRRGEKGIWQRRYWEHRIRDDDDLRRHVEYTYFNPVKHGLAGSVADWPCSSFHRDVKSGLFCADWDWPTKARMVHMASSRVGQAKRTHAVSATSMTTTWVRFA